MNNANVNTLMPDFLPEDVNKGMSSLEVTHHIYKNDYCNDDGSNEQISFYNEKNSDFGRKRGNVSD